MLKKTFNILIILQILALISLAGIIYFLYKVRVVEHINYSNEREDITDNTISNVKAEELSIDSLIKQTNASNINQEYFIQDKNSDNANQPVEFVYKINNDQIETGSILPNTIPAFYTSIDSQTLDDTTVSNIITQTIKQNNLTEIEIDVSITNKVNNIESIVRNILNNTSPNPIKINLGLPAKWSDIYNYTYLVPVSNFYNSTASIETLANLCNKIRINAYGYTTLYSSKAGPIVKLSWVENVIQYYIYKGLKPSQTSLIINNTAYEWANRDITDNYIQNYVMDAPQVNVLKIDDLTTIMSNSGFSISNNYNFDDNIAQLNNNGAINFIVYPKDSTTQALKDLAQSYSLSSYILKNF